MICNILFNMFFHTIYYNFKSLLFNILPNIMWYKSIDITCTLWRNSTKIRGLTVCSIIHCNIFIVLFFTCCLKTPVYIRMIFFLNSGSKYLLIVIPSFPSKYFNLLSQDVTTMLYHNTILIVTKLLFRLLIQFKQIFILHLSSDQ